MLLKATMWRNTGETDFVKKSGRGRGQGARSREQGAGNIEGRRSRSKRSVDPARCVAEKRESRERGAWGGDVRLGGWIMRRESFADA